MIDRITKRLDQLLTSMEEVAAQRNWRELQRLDGELADLLQRLKAQPELKSRLPMAKMQHRHSQLISVVAARREWLAKRLNGDGEMREGQRAYREVQLYGGEK